MSRRVLVFCALLIWLGIVWLGSAAARDVSAQTSVPAGDVKCGPATPCALSEAIASPVAKISFETASSGVNPVEGQPGATGFELAWAVMILMIAALLYALISAVWVALGRSAPTLPSGTSILIPILSVLGLGVAIYLTFIETTNAKAVCGPVGDCNTVQASPYAKLFGFLPVGLLGAVGYVAILAAWVLGKAGRGTLAGLAPLAIFGMALFGVLFSIYLTYLELLVIHAVCMWCLSSAVIVTLVLLLSVGGAMGALGGE